MKKILFLLLVLTTLPLPAKRTSRVLVLTEGAGQHQAMSDACLQWLEGESHLLRFTIQVLPHPNSLHAEADFDAFDLIIQLDYPPYAWSKETASAFEAYMQKGKGAWIGLHHATLLGDFDGYPMWQWFSDFMGGIRFRHYIAPLADGTVRVEEARHPIMRGVHSTFTIEDDEWYTYHCSPRPHVRVLANVDEDSYRPASDVRMGDHPVVWTNESISTRNVYFQMGHSPKLYQNKDFCRMFHNALKWALR